PTISAITNRVTSEDTPTAAIPFTISDSITPASLLTLAAQSSNPVLAPVGNIVLGASAINRTVTITPALNQSGSSTITISVTDTNFGSTNTSFVLTVNPVNDAPTISSIGSQTINENTALGPVPFTVGDVETPAGNLTVTGVSSNQTLAPNTNIVFGGSGASRAFFITPLNNQTGTTTITLTVSDGVATTSTSFVLTVNFANTPPSLSPIADQTINEDAATSPIGFTIGDFETPAASLVLSGSSLNP